MYCHGNKKNNGTVNQVKIYFFPQNWPWTSTGKKSLPLEKNNTDKTNKTAPSLSLGTGIWTASTYVTIRNRAHLYIHFVIRLRANLFELQSQKASKSELSFSERFFIPIHKNSYGHKSIMSKCGQMLESKSPPSLPLPPGWSHIESKGHVFSKTTIDLSKNMWQKHVKPCSVLRQATIKLCQFQYFLMTNALK